MEKWEYSASDVKDVANRAPLRKLNAAKQKIMKEIYQAAYNGDTYFVIYIGYYEVSCPEDWSNIYNWLLKLGYEVTDNSNAKWTAPPNFYVSW